MSTYRNPHVSIQPLSHPCAFCFHRQRREVTRRARCVAWYFCFPFDSPVASSNLIDFPPSLFLCISSLSLYVSTSIYTYTHPLSAPSKLTINSVMNAMEEIIAEELEIERKLKKLEAKSLTMYNLKDIQKPEDVRMIADRERAKASLRNTTLLEELDFTVAKLHTKRLCPLQKKLDDLLNKTYQSGGGSLQNKDRKKCQH